MGFFDRLKEGLRKTRESFTDSMDQIFNTYEKVTEDFYDELEETMIMGDIGVKTTEELLDHLREEVREERIKYAADCRQELILGIRNRMKQGKDAYDFEKGPAVVLVIGVNGVGKTTSIGKLAANYKKQGKRVLIASADTFRAAANEQLTEWARRAGVDIISAAEGSDPASVVYDAVQAAKARKIDILLCDTAGRLHNKKNLMNELSKIDRIITREFPECYRENWVVLDAATGQNAVSQAREFASVTNLTGIVLTKMDGTAKGGIAIAVQAEVGVPVKFIGVGEKIEDLQRFNPDEYVDALFY
ncbi:MAG: signal recognition particle-docking protein FtsY [Sarcina sp.]|uniref:signal recognition particle-docking protein FtsY n=1 Tax=Sarcina sp. DSM 11001 TaxID=1798184 RepID=UPI00087E4F56|nr:signal recognition particle-docking protein FtsY [Sarcina sp. DSM 11001]MDO5485284.1 signal recognition particle-docking protein FtsY [Sarcina sp.]SDK99023.1 fused signal recognition particle receptor [Sarcina sp. DSM 11001]